MAMSKYALAGSLEKKTLNLQDKIKFLDFADEHKNLGCRKLAEVFGIGKTAASNILKSKQKLRNQYEQFHEKNKKRCRPGKYKAINDILYIWYQKCCSSGLYPNGPMLKEEAMEIKKQLNDSALDGFVASDGWLDKWKASYAVKEKRIVGEGGEVSTETVSSWIERLKEMTEGYSPENIWNMDETGCFFKALPDSGLIQKGTSAKGGKKSKQRFTVAFFVNAAGEKEDEPIVIWKSKKPRCFKGLKNPSRPANVHYFSNKKSWMNSEIFETVLSRLNKRLLSQKRKIILFLDNATCHPETLEGKFSNIKIKFLPKNTTSRLQPLDAGIIRNFKVKYRKSLVKYVLSRISDGSSAAEIASSVNVLMAIRWVQRAWQDVLPSTIKRCFEKCGFCTAEADIDVEEDDDEEFAALVKELCPELSIDDYVDFDANLPTTEPSFTTETVGWREEARLYCINAVQNPLPDNDEIASDDDEVEDEADPEENLPSVLETLTLLDRASKCPELDEDTLNALDRITQAVERIRIEKKKQKSIKDYFV